MESEQERYARYDWQAFLFFMNKYKIDFTYAQAREEYLKQCKSCGKDYFQHSADHFKNCLNKGKANESPSIPSAN